MTAISIKSTLKRRFLAGLVVLIPGLITITAIVWLFKFIDGLLGRFYDDFLGYHLSGLGFVTAIVLVLIVGFISTNVFGKKIISLADMIFLRIPVFKGIYTAFKQLVDAFSPDNKNSSFKKFVIVEYPRQGSFAFGFLTKECTVKSEKNGRESCLRAVYVPTNNLYLGDIVLVREGDVFYTDLSIEEGIRIILSGGIATPSRILEGQE